MVHASTARLAGVAVLSVAGVLQWRRMVEGAGLGRALLWAAVAVGAGAALVAAGRLRRHRDAAMLGAAAGGLAAAVAASGIPLVLFKPARWDQLADGLTRGLEAVGEVWLPYAGANPWPGLTIQLLGSLLCTLAGLLAFWPRENGRGYPFIALAGLLALPITPVVSLGGGSPLVLGGVLTAGTIVFLWLERLPLRPGIGVAALLALALAGAVPLAGVADRETPWFDYRTFAEGLGTDKPVRFSWRQDYGPIDWPRTRSEVMRVAARRPSYWKLQTLEDFDGMAWRDRAFELGRPAPELDLPYGWEGRGEWRERLRVTLRRLRAHEVVGAGTTLRVTGAGAGLRLDGEPGGWRRVEEFGNGDSYAVDAYVPRPTADELAESTTARQADELGIVIPVRRLPADARSRGKRRSARAGSFGSSNGASSGAPSAAPSGGALARVRFAPFDADGMRRPDATYLAINRVGSGGRALRGSPYARTWRLVRRLRAQAETPYDYVAEVAQHLTSGYAYSERPPAPGVGVAPLDAFLFDGRLGYCQHFAGAMALLLRMGGVPARVATGFTPGGYSERKAAWVVRDTDAHAWVEVWFDRFGWVAMDPTPSNTPARSQIAALVTSEERDQATGAFGEGPQSASIDPKPIPTARPGAADGAGVGAATGDDGAIAWWWPILGLAALAALAATVLRRLDQGAVDQAGRLERAIAELEAALRRMGRSPGSGLTLRQLEQRLGTSSEAAAYLRALRSGRYAPALPPPPTAAQRRALRRALAAGGGPRARFRALLALPPWRA